MTDYTAEQKALVKQLALPTTQDPAWLVLARKELGVREKPGAPSNPRIDEYLASAHGAPGDETPWCSAFMCWLMQHVGLPSTSRLAARSWMKWGRDCGAPVLGAVTVLWRDSVASPHGHVGIFLAETEDGVWLLGGNEDNAVSIRHYPHNRILSYRLPA